MKKRNVALLLIAILVTTLFTPMSTAALNKSVVTTLESEFPDLIFHEIEISETVTILQVYEIATWTSTTKKPSANLQALTDRAAALKLTGYARIYYEEISPNGDKLGSFSFNPQNDYWQAAVYEKAVGAPDPTDYAQYTVADYQAFARRPDDYEGDLIQITGKVLQVMEDSSGVMSYRVAQNSNYDQVWYVAMLLEPGADRILEDDQVTFYGEYYGLMSYQTVMGATLTIPSMLATKHVFK